MARKRHARQNQRLGASPRLQKMVDSWLHRFRACVPEDASVVATIHKIAGRTYLISFRVAVQEEALISEVRAESIARGVQEAGARLQELLAQSPLRRPRRSGLGERVRRFFEEAS